MAAKAQAGPRVLKFKAGDTTYEIDPTTLELDEAVFLEDQMGGLPLAVWEDGDWFSAKALRGLAFLAMSREDDSLTLEDAGKLRMLNVMDDEEEVPPTKPAAKRAKKSAGD